MSVTLARKQPKVVTHKHSRRAVLIVDLLLKKVRIARPPTLGNKNVATGDVLPGTGWLKLGGWCFACRVNGNGC